MILSAVYMSQRSSCLIPTTLVLGYRHLLPHLAFYVGSWCMGAMGGEVHTCGNQKGTLDVLLLHFPPYALGDRTVSVI